MFDVQHLSYQAGRKPLLRDVSLQARPGELLAIVGANGAGKSTLLRLLSGDVAPSDGLVQFDGQPLASIPAAMLARRRAVLTQQHTLSLAFRVQELVLMGRYPYFRGQPSAHDYAVVADALATVGLSALAERSYPTLSGGEQQRAQLARVLAQVWEAELGFLLLDEPLTGLDLNHQHHTLDVARALVQRGFGVVAVLHDLNLAAQYADQVLVLRQGAVVASGVPAAVLTAAHIEHAFDIAVELLPHPSLDCPLIVPRPRAGVGAAFSL
ncbi:heme ABC transporter ATP-binding protein [Hymenobacter cellulosivorans]|uniref:Heme ABC transporter ATP-binding protein n=1 Tax=Hymenobacter cellulosivorans TaxID=2932249 RepID=A0ABY4FDP7_9BACT|nr:heme ABC transporter ATP-binding protein [Hymenobacter cellulosivorans]UOQ54805.1 heme ABC transporter ATP-binding protein [Hymenobacter cellulosivorans]